MKILLVIPVLLLLSGCASDEEDRAFFNRGWIRPEAGANARINSSH